ncbi:MAG: cytochrome c [Acetobacteraceae bacterium]|nr:cytochrome c [Acetobacteraceae bacterium]
MHQFPKMVVATTLGLLSGLHAPAGVAQTPPAPPGAGKPLDVPQLFATTCGWCHSDGGRTAGKGPQLMDTKRSDDYIRMRIKNGKEGAMPAFKGVLSDADIDAIIHYVRTLKPN